MKEFFEVTLVPLIPRGRTVVYRKFSPEFNEFNHVLKATGSSQNMTKNKTSKETTYI